MPVPKRKRSRARRDKRFANKGLKVQAIAECKNCQAPLQTHTACLSCGHYKGVKVLVTKMDRALKRGETRKVKGERQQARVAKMQQAQEQAPVDVKAEETK